MASRDHRYDVLVCGGGIAGVAAALEAAAALETERNLRKIIGHEDLWMLTAVLAEDRLLSDESQNPVDNGRVAA